MRQKTLADEGFEKFRKKTRKEQFLDEMECIIPRQELTAAIEPFYPNPQGAGRRPAGVEWMLHIYFLQHWFKNDNRSITEQFSLPFAHLPRPQGGLR